TKLLLCLKYLVAASVLVTTVGAANADHYVVEATFSEGVSLSGFFNMDPSTGLVGFSIFSISGVPPVSPPLVDLGVYSYGGLPNSMGGNGQGSWVLGYQADFWNHFDIVMAGDSIGYTGGPITGGLISVQRGVCFSGPPAFCEQFSDFFSFVS